MFELSNLQRRLGLSGTICFVHLHVYILYIIFIFIFIALIIMNNYL